MQFSDQLRNLRLSRKYTQLELAKRLDVTQAAVAQWETNTRTPDLDTLRRIASCFQVPVSSLVSPEGEAGQLDRIVEAITARPKLLALFEKAAMLPDDQLDALQGVANAFLP